MKLSRILAVSLVGTFATGGWAQDVMPNRATGDVTGDDHVINVTDAIYLLTWLFNGGPAPEPVFCEQAGGGITYPLVGPSGYTPRFESGNPGRAADVNGDGGADITDAIALLNWLYLGGDDPAPMSCVPFGDV